MVRKWNTNFETSFSFRQRNARTIWRYFSNGKWRHQTPFEIPALRWQVRISREQKMKIQSWQRFCPELLQFFFSDNNKKCENLRLKKCCHLYIHHKTSSFDFRQYLQGRWVIYLIFCFLRSLYDLEFDL